jgi:hypothetical protein
MTFSSSLRKKNSRSANNDIVILPFALFLLSLRKNKNKQLNNMTIKEFYETNWHRGNEVRLNNGKEYLVKGTKGHGRFLLLFSEEYEKCFIADYKIVDCRTSDYEEPEEVYLEKKRLEREAAEAQREAERLERLREKQERKLRNLEEQERQHQEALARKAAKKKAAEEKKAEGKKAEQQKAKAEAKPASKVEPKSVAKPVAKPIAKAEPVATSEPTAEQPKRKRKRITISRVEKVEIKYGK